MRPGQHPTSNRFTCKDTTSVKCKFGVIYWGYLLGKLSIYLLGKLSFQGYQHFGKQYGMQSCPSLFLSIRRAQNSKYRCSFLTRRLEEHRALTGALWEHWTYRSRRSKFRAVLVALAGKIPHRTALAFGPAKLLQHLPLLHQGLVE